MSQTPEICKVRKYLALTLDPVHIGTGEFQLGRVDNTIVREPGTGLPKIPGSSIAGVTRAYLDLLDRALGRDPAKTSCAGKGGKEGDAHCGNSSCPVCMAFGFSKGQKSFQGLVQFSDARMLFFPVYSLLGPVWVTSPSTLRDAGIHGFEKDLSNAHDLLYSGGKHEVWLCAKLGAGTAGQMNMGWLYLPTYKGDQILHPDNWEWSGTKLSEVDELKPILPRIAMVDDQLFPIIVEDQLEVRTTVSINPATGAAEDGALFTSEAIPRGALLTFQVTATMPKFFTNPSDPAAIGFDEDSLHAETSKAMGQIALLGLGGSNTRGNGRVRISPVEKPVEKKA